MLAFGLAATLRNHRCPAIVVVDAAPAGSCCNTLSNVSVSRGRQPAQAASTWVQAARPSDHHVRRLGTPWGSHARPGRRKCKRSTPRRDPMGAVACGTCARGRVDAPIAGPADPAGLDPFIRPAHVGRKNLRARFSGRGVSGILWPGVLNRLQPVTVFRYRPHARCARDNGDRLAARYARR